MKWVKYKDQARINLDNCSGFEKDRDDGYELITFFTYGKYYARWEFGQDFSDKDQDYDPNAELKRNEMFDKLTKLISPIIMELEK